MRHLVLEVALSEVHSFKFWERLYHESIRKFGFSIYCKHGVRDGHSCVGCSNPDMSIYELALAEAEFAVRHNQVPLLNLHRTKVVGKLP